MTDESSEQKITPEVSEDKLAEVAGGGFIENMVGDPLHKGCGGKIEPRDFLGITATWYCTKCFECHDSLESFDFYLSKPSPMF